MKTHIPQKVKSVEPIISDFKAEIKKLYGENLMQMVLYGSYARGNPHDESDIDLLLVLNKMTSPYRENLFINEVKSNFSLEHDVYISVVTTTMDLFNTMPNPLYFNIKKEGIIV